MTCRARFRYGISHANDKRGCDYFLKATSPEGYLYDCQFIPIGWSPRRALAELNPN